jgi:fatty-acyl-CoA synthase
LLGSLRSGLLVTVNRYLTAPEAAYIIADSGARVVDPWAMRDLAAQLGDHARPTSGG